MIYNMKLYVINLKVDKKIVLITGGSRGIGKSLSSKAATIHVISLKN